MQRQARGSVVAVLTAVAACGAFSATGPPAPSADPSAAPPAPDGWHEGRRDTVRGTVVLLHGLGRTHRSMGAMAAALEEAGYRVVNLGYPSREEPIAELADSVAAALDACCSPGEGAARPVHFVTHSLGGILVRAYQGAYGADRIGRVVMLSPPNQGSEVVDRIPEGFLELVLGPAAIQLGTDTAAVVHDLPPPAFELGIITGSATLNPLFSWWLPGRDDGKVSVASARLDGADAFLVVPYSHTWIMRRGEVIEQVLTFLETGAFREAAPAPAR